MAGFWRRWRAPLLGGIAVWLFSFPLITSHPAAITSASAAHRTESAAVEAGDHRLFVQRAREEQAALAALQVLSAAAATAMPVAAAPANAVPAVAPATPKPPRPLVARANTIVIPRLGFSQPVGWYSDCLGRAPVPRWGAWGWGRAGGNKHHARGRNPGASRPIRGLTAA